MPSGLEVFDRRALVRNRERYAPGHSFVKQTMLQRLEERIDILSPFLPNHSLRVLEVGAGAECQLNHVLKSNLYVATDLSAKRLQLNKASHRVCLHEEHLPFKDESFHFIVSCGFLHHLEHWPAFLKEVGRVLSPGGVLLANFLGGETLYELAASFLHSERKATPHVSLFCRLEDMNALAKMGAFSSSVVDTERLTQVWETPLALMQALKEAGEANPLKGRCQTLTSPRLIERVADFYTQNFGCEGGVLSTFDIFTLTVYK